MQTENKKIAFLGDSITCGVGASTPEKAYASLVARDGGFSESYNFGVSATRIANQVAEDPRGKSETFVERIDRMPDNIDIVLVFGGTNDYGHGDAPFGKPTDRTPDTFYGAMDKMLTKLIEKYPRSKIVLLTPIHREAEEKYINEYGVRNCATLGEYVTAEKAVAARYSIPVIDLYETSGICPDNKINKETYTVDGLHPNDTGHRVIADKILSFIKYSL